MTEKKNKPALVKEVEAEGISIPDGATKDELQDALDRRKPPEGDNITVVEATNATTIEGTGRL